MRIIAGRAKGRRLSAPDTTDTRPATDRAREAIFSAIGPWVQDADVLDLYAGSGSYGLEALSRGASSATFVERGRKALVALRENVATVGLGGVIVAQAVDEFLSSPGPRTYHLVFVDPPWDLPTTAIDAHLARIDSLLEPGAEIVVTRREGDDAPAPLSGWTVATDRRYGDARIYRYAIDTTREQTMSHETPFLS